LRTLPGTQHSIRRCKEVGLQERKVMLSERLTLTILGWTVGGICVLTPTLSALALP
jgi:hypothetical protein